MYSMYIHYHIVYELHRMYGCQINIHKHDLKTLYIAET